MHDLVYQPSTRKQGEEERNPGSSTIDFQLLCLRLYILGRRWGGGGGGVEFFVETLSSDQKKENIYVVSLGIDSGGIEVDKYALFISNVISIQ